MPDRTHVLPLLMLVAAAPRGKDCKSMITFITGTRAETLAWGINQLVEPFDIPQVVSDILKATTDGQEWPKAGDAYGVNPSNQIAGIIEKWMEERP